MNDIAAWASVIATVVATITLVVFLWQTILIRKSLDSQTFQAILAAHREIKHSEAMRVIRSLQCRDYQTYKKQVPIEQQKLIEDTVSFLNSMNHLLVGSYVPMRTLLRMYHCNIIDAGKKLLPWYVQGVNQEADSIHLFHNFEMLFEHVKKLEETDIFKNS